MTASTISRLRRIPVPRTEPPYDDETQETHQTGETPTPLRGPATTPWVQGALAVALPFESEPFPAPGRPPLRLISTPDVAPPVDHPDEDDETGGSSPAPPVHRAWVGRLAQATVEVLSGERAPRQLLGWTSDDVYAAMARRADALASRRPNVDLTRRPPVLLRSVHVSQPADDVAEVCALVRRGERTRAIALRLEACRGQWRCTAFELG